MSSVLESVEWGKSALAFIKHSKELDPKLPAFIHIRHSERPSATQRQTGFKLPLTEEGEKASYELGNNLPTSRRYHLYHTDIARTLVTAENIIKGIQKNEGAAKIVGEIPLASAADMEEAGKAIMAARIGKSDVEGARNFFYRWISGLYPPWVMNPSLEFAQRGASLMMKALESSEPDDLLIWVSHENWIAAFLHHWLGEYSFNWVSFLDGFILQFYDDYIVSYFREEKKKLEYPYWWKT